MLLLSIVVSPAIYSIYLVLFVLQVAHKASTRARQRCRSAETCSRRPHVQPFSFISLSTVLLQVSLGRPLFLWPSGVHHRAILVKAVVCWRSTCPIHRQRLRLTWVEMGSISALRCGSSVSPATRSIFLNNYGWELTSSLGFWSIWVAWIYIVSFSIRPTGWLADLPGIVSPSHCLSWVVITLIWGITSTFLIFFYINQILSYRPCL